MEFDVMHAINVCIHLRNVENIENAIGIRRLAFQLQSRGEVEGHDGDTSELGCSDRRGRAFVERRGLTRRVLRHCVACTCYHCGSTCCSSHQEFSPNHAENYQMMRGAKCS